MTNMNEWDASHIVDQSGKIAIITGGNTGLGFEISKQLAKHGAEIVIASRSKEKGIEAIMRMQKLLGKPVKGTAIALDLTDQNSIKDFAESFFSQYDRLDLLVNNAGVVNLKEKMTTKDGYEMHMATNHFGHFALAARLYPALKKSDAARVVTMSSGASRSGVIDFDDLNWEKRPYDRMKSYGDSKLANMYFAKSLQQKFDADGLSALSLTAHPGLSATERQQSIGMGGWFTKMLAQPVSQGALPALYAATHPNVKALEYYGPKYGIRGKAKLINYDANSLDQGVGDQLWQVTEQATGVEF